MSKPKQSGPTPEYDALGVQLRRMEDMLKRALTLYADSTLTPEQSRDLIAEELVILQECGKSCMRLILKP